MQSDCKAFYYENILQEGYVIEKDGETPFAACYEKAAKLVDKLLEENKARIAKQKREKLSDRKMELYINLDNETSSEESSLPPIEKRVIKLNTAIPEDEDFGL